VSVFSSRLVARLNGMCGQCTKRKPRPGLKTCDECIRA